MMRVWFRSALVGLALLVGAASPAVADPLPILDGSVRQPAMLSTDLLRSLPRTEIDVTFETGKGRETGHYAGALLWTIVDKADLINGDGKNAALRHTLLITGRDGYAVALALGEIEPNFEAKSVILAYESGNPPVAMSKLRLIVPGDAHGGRSVDDVVHIEVR